MEKKHAKQCSGIKFILILFFFNVLTDAKTTLLDLNTNETIEFLTYNALPWDIDLNIPKNLPFIPVDTPFENFDPCEKNTYYDFIVSPLIENVYNITNANHDNNFDFDVQQGWIAILHMPTLMANCIERASIDIGYITLYSLLLQRLKATLVIFTSLDTPGFEPIVVPPNVDIQNQMVKGIKIHLPIVVAPLTNSDGLSVVKALRSTNYRWIVHSKIELDANPLHSVLNPVGFYRFAWLFMGFLSVCLLIFQLRLMNDVHQYYKPKTDIKSQVALQMRMMILVPEVVSGLARCVGSIDPLGVFHIHNYFFGRFVFNFSSSLATFTDIVTILYCRDVYNIFRASRTEDVEIPFLMKYRLGRITIFFAFSMIILDQIILHMGLTYQLGPNSLIIVPMIYLLFVNISTAVSLLKMSSMMSREVALAYQSLECSLMTDKRMPPVSINNSPTTVIQSHKNQKSSKDTTNNMVVRSPLNPLATSSNENMKIVLLKRTKSLLQMRKYFILAGYGRLVNIVGIALVGTRWVEQGPLNYAFTLLLIGYSHLFSSFGQIMAALQLPHKNVSVGTKMKTDKEAARKGSYKSKDKIDLNTDVKVATP